MFIFMSFLKITSYIFLSELFFFKNLKIIK